MIALESLVRLSIHLILFIYSILAVRRLPYPTSRNVTTRRAAQKLTSRMFYYINKDFLRRYTQKYIVYTENLLHDSQDLHSLHLPHVRLNVCLSTSLYSQTTLGHMTMPWPCLRVQ